VETINLNKKNLKSYIYDEKINGDNPGSILRRIFYFYQCIINHGRGSLKYHQICTPKLSISYINTFKKTPSRLLCDGFWNTLNYTNLKFQLGNKLNIFDVGCGSGKYGNFLKKLSGKAFSSYSGLDIYKHHEYPQEFFHFKDTAENIGKYINKETNFVISQSALEHIKYDLYVIEEITKKLNETKKPFIQIHMLPATRCLWLYLWHGYRQYSYKNLSFILNHINKNFNLNSSIIPIGGDGSFWFHLKNITLPVYFGKLIFNRKLYEWYNHESIEEKISKVVSKELLCKEKKPIFWALIITSKNINIKNIFTKNNNE